MLEESGFQVKRGRIVTPLVYKVEVDPSQFEEAEELLDSNDCFVSYACDRVNDMTTIEWE